MDFDKDRPAGLPEWADRVLRFWFAEVGPDGWWGHSPALDDRCAAEFGETWEEYREAQADSFLDRADLALAAILLFDQLPRNMFRGLAKAFDTDALAREIARGAIARGYDIQIGGAGRAFFYMPFQHSEVMADQELSLVLFEATGDTESLDYAREHHAMIARFGRFPHRNAALGRKSLPEEKEAIAEGSQW